MFKNKIIPYSQLPKLINQLKQSKRKIVLVGGCFDILHFGHIKFLQQAQKLGTLLVALESDQNLRKYKGVSRPIHKQNQRAEVLATLSVVDYIILLPPFSSDKQYELLTQTVSPKIIAVTAGDPQLDNKTKQAQSVGGKIKIFPSLKTPSTSQLVKLLQLAKT